MRAALFNSGWHSYGQIRCNFLVPFRIRFDVLSLKSLSIHSPIILGWKQAGFETITQKQ
jgi:hypothetical protein